MQAPKFSPGEPAITVSVLGIPENHNIRVIVLDVVEFFGEWNYKTLPDFGRPLGIAGQCLRPLPPEELAGCFDANEVPRKDEVSA